MRSSALIFACAGLQASRNALPIRFLQRRARKHRVVVLCGDRAHLGGDAVRATARDPRRSAQRRWPSWRHWPADENRRRRKTASQVDRRAPCRRWLLPQPQTPMTTTITISLDSLCCRRGRVLDRVAARSAARLTLWPPKLLRIIDSSSIRVVALALAREAHHQRQTT